jgi:RING-box protein 1
MADVNMTDAPAPKPKSAKAGSSAETGEKKRFEVKKVGGRANIDLAWTDSVYSGMQ